MDKFVIGLAALVVGLGMGAFVVAPMLEEKQPEPKQANPSVTPAITQDQLDELNRLKADAVKAREAADRASVSSAGLEGRDAETSTRDQEPEAVRKLTQELAAVKSELVAYKSRTEAAEAKVYETELERLAKVEATRAQGKALSVKVKELIAEGKGKKEVLAALRELGALGTDAAAEFYDAFGAVSAIGNPFSGEGNTLKLTFPEYFSLMSDNMSMYTLTEGRSVAPDDAKIWAMYGVAYGSPMDASDKAKLFGGFLDTGDKGLASHAIETLGLTKDPAAVPYLMRSALNGGFEPDVRAKALNTLINFGDDVDWNQVSSLENDPDPRVASAARVGLATRNPGATGLLITTVTPDGAADKAGVKVGDIITRYNGVEVRDVNSLIQARNATADVLEVPIVVARGNGSVTLQVPKGQLGIDGRAVEKK